LLPSVPNKFDGDVSELLHRRDAAALEDLVTCYRPLLRALADRDLDSILRPKVDVSDVVQETCVDVVRGFSSMEARSRGQFINYLKALLKHRIQDVRRRFLFSQKRSVLRETTMSPLGSEVDVDVSDSVVMPLDELVDGEYRDRLRLVLGRLPRELQRLLWWRFRKEMSYREIGAKLDRTGDDVRMLVQRCLARIRPEVFSDDTSR